MKTFDFYKKIENKNIYNLLDKNMILFDIETTGLSRKYSHIYMIGTGKIIDNNLFIRQFFAFNKNEEKEIILRFLSYLKNNNIIVTFNGDSFDIPFLEERCNILGIDFDRYKYKTIDLYKKIKKINNLLNLPSLKQKSIEDFLGIHRNDMYDGGYLIKVYNDYTISLSPDLEYLLMIHNREDIKGIIDLFSMIFYEKLKKASISMVSYDKKDSYISFTVNTDIYIPKSIKIINKKITLSVKPYLLEGQIPLEDNKIRYYFDNYKDYVYLIDDKKIIPKVLISSIDKNKYRKVKKDECYVLIDIDKVDNNYLVSYIKNFLEN